MSHAENAEVAEKHKAVFWERAMCCFSGAVEHVAETKIFARSKPDGRQVIVYEMHYESKDAIAMILPLPTPKNSKETAVEFVNLKKYREFFHDLEKGFPRPRAKVGMGGLGGTASGSFETAPKLAVKDVGDFEASFVPTMADFARLDERFRLPESIWTETASAYRDWGFAVFKLKSGKHHAHPMAFSFPRKDARSLFYPTMHIHDGSVHDEAEFDHALYCQISDDTAHDLMNWRESSQWAGMFMKPKRAPGVVELSSHVYKQVITGTRKNEDIFV